MKFKKIYLVTFLVVFVLLSSCVSAFAVTNYNRDKIIQSIKNSDKVKELTAGKYYFATVLQGTYTFVDVCVSKNQYLVSDNSIVIPASDYELYRFSVSDDSEIFFSEKVSCYSNYFCQLNNSNDMSSGCLLVSNYDLKTVKGEVFFDNPTLLKQLLNLVPQGVGNKITADLGTLTVCGIGCLALLIGLSLLPKVFYKFL